MIFCKYFATISLYSTFGTATLNADATLHAAPAICLNCNAATTGNFCQQCSQETVLHPPSTREFLHEFIGHYVALEGKLWKSLWLLMCKPGRLTMEYIRGRRVRHVQPLRMYLTFSLIFFALIKLSGVHFFENEEDATPARVAISQAAEAAKPNAPVRVRSEGEEITDRVGTAADQLHHGWGERVNKFMSLPKHEMGLQLKKTFFSFAPYALFALMPVFALLLKLLYLGTGRRFGAHLLFALHANAFAFAMLALQIAIPSGWGFVHFALLVWMVVYLPLAMHHVYGGGWFVTVVRWLVLMLLHLLCIVLAIATTLGSAFVV